MLCLMACTPGSNSDGIVISNARIKTPLTGKTTTAGFFEITNHGTVQDALIGAESPIAETVEIHLTEMENGVMKMRRQESVILKPGQSLSFKPGSYHLMFFGTTLKPEQHDTALTLKFQNAPDVTIIAEITDGMGGAHQGH